MKNAAGIYVDVNGVIHPFCHGGPETAEMPEETKIQNILSYFDHIIEMISPSAVVFFAIDGVAPRAKLCQQRARRYMSAACEDGAEEGGAPADGFDSNCISPGTEFMRRVSLAIQAYIAEKLSSESRWNHLKFFFSDSSVPCEGEHKIFTFIKGQMSRGDYLSSGHHVIVGLDADLIMLSLVLHLPRVALMRDITRGNHSSPSFEFLDIDSLGESLVTEMYHLSQLKEVTFLAEPQSYSRVSARGYEFGFPQLQEGPFHPCTAAFNSKLIDDFVFLTFLVGNDFVPHLPSAFTGVGALDHFMECYLDDVLPYGFLTDGRGEVNMTQLRRFFVSYAKYEEHLFVTCKSLPSTPEDDDGDEEAKESKGDSKANSSEELSFASIREELYQSTKLTASASIEEVCRDYIQTLQMVWRYYSRMNDMDWSWFYSRFFAPLAVDLASYLSHPHKPLATNPNQKPCDPVLQLLSILPPSSAGLLPRLFQPLLTPSPEHAHVVSRWQVDYTGACGQSHLAVVLLPPADLVALAAQYEPLKQHFIETEDEEVWSINVTSPHHLLYYRVKEQCSCAEECEEDESCEMTGVNLCGVREHASTTDGVRCDRYTNEEPEHPPRPRCYSWKAPIAAKFAATSRTPPLAFVDVVCLLFAFSMILAIWLSSFHLVALGLVSLQVMALFLGVILLAYALGLATGPQPSLSIFRLRGGRTFLNWVCAECGSMCFEKKTECFSCGAPYIASKCKALFTTSFKEDAAELWKPNHTSYLRCYHLKSE